MNIIVRLFKGRFCFRPDTSWERENRDFFSPDFMRKVVMSPVVFGRMAKAGKFVGRKFVERYYEGVGYGMLIYNGEVLADGAADSVAYASMIDHGSILPFPLYQTGVIARKENVFGISVDGEEVFSTQGLETDALGMLEDAICSGSEIISLRTGDIVAVELAEPQMIVYAEAGGGERICVEGRFCENEIFKFDVVM